MSKSTALARAELARQPRLKRVINNLPKHAHAKHFLFTEFRERASAWSDAQFAKVQKLARDRENTNLEIGSMERYDYALTKADLERLQGLRNESAAYRAAGDEARAEQNPFVAPPDEVYERAILRLGHSTRYVEARKTALLRKGESVADGLVRVRATIADIETAMKGVRAAQVTTDEVKARIVRSVDALARQGEPNFADVLHNRRGNEPNRVVHWPEVYTVQSSPVGDGMALMAFLWRDAMIEALTAKALEQHRGDGISDAARRDKLADLRGKLLEVEREEENLIERCEASGESVRRYYRFSEDDHAQNERRLWALFGIQRASYEEDFG